MLRLVSDGLYANAGDRVTVKQFDSWKNSFSEYKTNMERYLRELIEKYDAASDITSPQSISQRIISALEEVYPEIDEALEKFNNMASQFETIEKRVKDYADTRYALAYADLYAAIIDATANPWEYFGDIPQPPEIPDENGVPDPDENSGEDGEEDNSEEPKGETGEEGSETELPENNGETENPEEKDDGSETEYPTDNKNSDSGNDSNESENDAKNEDNVDESEPKQEESEDENPDNSEIEPELENSETL